MAKHRKTRREKKVADHRHPIYHLEIKTAQEDIKPASKKEKSSINEIKYPIHNQATAYTYVANDLKKTLFITSIILTTQIVLFFILNRV